jgi:hypothetical protein
MASTEVRQEPGIPSPARPAAQQERERRRDQWQLTTALLSRLGLGCFAPRAAAHGAHSILE